MLASPARAIYNNRMIVKRTRAKGPENALRRKLERAELALRIRGKEKVAHYLEQGAPLLHPRSLGPIPVSRLASHRRILLEIGCGRGAFLLKMAASHPEDLIIGLEKYTPIIARAAAIAASHGISNAVFLESDAAEAPDWIPQGRCDALYLNFSDPWPRRRNETKRLTHARFLAGYERLLAPGGRLEFKTDNADFFEWSIRSFRQAGWRTVDILRALPADEDGAEAGVARYVQTEYERRFRSLGQPIYFLCTIPKNSIPGATLRAPTEA